MAGLLDYLSGMNSAAGQGLLATGLGILANNRGLTSGSQAIGLGGLQGLQVYNQAQSQELKNAQIAQLKLQQKIAGSLLGGGAPQTGTQPAQTNAYIPQAAPPGSGMWSPDAAGASPPVQQSSQGFSPFLGAQKPPLNAPTQQQQQAPNVYLGGAKPTQPASGMGMFAPENLQNLAALKLVGGADMMDFHKFANTPQQISPGYLKDPMTGAISYMPDPYKGVDYDPRTKTVTPLNGYSSFTADEANAKKGMVKMRDGSWSYPLGVVSAESRMEGSKAGAKAAAESQYKLEEVAGPNGTTQVLPVATIVGGINRGSPVIKQDTRATNLAHFGGRAAATNSSEIFKGATEAAAAANAAIEDVDHLMTLANAAGRTGRTLSFVKPGVAEFLSPDAAEYGKRRANLIAQSSAAFGANTDASRANIEKMIPAYGLPNQAQSAGLESVKNQLLQKRLMADVLTRYQNAGHEQGLIAANSAMSTHLKPEMMPQLNEVLQPRSNDGRAAAVQELMKSQSGAKVLELLHDAGMLQ